MVAIPRALTLDEFMQRYSDEGPFELVEGEIIKMSPQVAGSGDVAGLLYIALYQHVTPNRLGKIFVEVPFVILWDETQWVKGSRVPDVMFYNATRFEVFVAENPDWKLKPIALVPDFVAEVVSPTDRFSQVNEKVARYLADGVRLVWVLDLQRKTITAHTPDSIAATYAGDVTISAGDVIPGFEITLSALFAD